MTFLSRFCLENPKLTVGLFVLIFMVTVMKVNKGELLNLFVITIQECAVPWGK